MKERLATLVLLLGLAAVGRAEDEGPAVYAEAKRFTFKVYKDATWDAGEWIFRRGEYGTGVGYRADGWVLVTAHQVRGARSVTLVCPDGVARKADRWVWLNTMDLGLVHVPGYEVPVPRFGASADLRVGATVYAVGMPFKFDMSMTRGIVGGLHRTLVINGRLTRDFQDYIQTDAQANAGNSGGPLLNARGEVVGLVCESLVVVNNAPGMSFALPVDVVRPMAARLVVEQTGLRSAALGGTLADCDELPAEVRERHGCRRNEGGFVVAAGKKCRAAGLRDGDVIVAIDGVPVVNWMHLRVRIAVHRPGDKVVLRVDRRGEELEFRVELDQWRE
jgi:serine protease Do